MTLKAGRIQKNWIIVASIAVTFYYSIKTLVATWFPKTTRRKVDVITRVWAQKLLQIAHVNYRVFNQGNTVFAANKSYVLMSNHCSNYDIPLIFATIDGSVRMIVKKELFSVPVWGHAMKYGEFISIDRENARQAVRDLRLAREKMQSGIMIWVAPEGTRSRTGKVQPFKKGGFMIALQTGAIIIPIGIRGSGNILPPKTWDVSVNENVEIHVGAPIDTDNYSSRDVARLMADVESSIKILVG